ncbi:hypothetical protein BZA05DRAFT_343908 [Tricharina praecox]|uniref:uncharacterized protein n=1 Tax=Tricharina praecox TaxID=43433 RepID=UPI002220360C|nr:uncharacterized protein BZA05DRAFT_343908 [Tricharina praecox]KAI5843260.1 hypothetical protein BZA05DRAFT_343908 [Tricharina praecox]
MPPINSSKSEHIKRTAASNKPRAEFYTWENLPPQELVAACISAFYTNGIASLLCPVPEIEANDMFRSIYGNAAASGSTPAVSASARNVIRATNNNFRLCQVLLLAAVGSQYLEETVKEEARNALFTSGKWYLHMAFGRDAIDVQRLRANSLAALYLIFQKSIAVVEHLTHRAADTGRRNVMDVIPDELNDNWPAWKRAWRSLAFLDGASSSGSGSSDNSSSNNSSDYNSSKNATEQDFDMHRQLEQLGVLMGAITSDVISPRDVPLNTVRVYSDRLKAWHANLPSSLTLSTAVRESHSSESPLNHSTLLIHCAYLGSIAQLTRRILVSRVTAQLTGSSDVEHATAEEFSKICVSAARQLATVVGMLRVENKLNRRCWLVIQSAYTAGLIICLDVARNRGRPMLESVFNESLDLISKCIATMQHCASFDAVADGYLAVLRPMFNTLRTPEPTRAAKRARMFRDPSTGQNDPAVSGAYPSNEALLDHILELMRAPYGGESTILDQDFFAVPGRTANVAEYYRFMHQSQQQPQQQQQQQHHQHHHQHQHHQQQHHHQQQQHQQYPQQQQQQHLQNQQHYAQLHVPPSPNRARMDAPMRGTEESTSPRQQGKGHPWTKEEYEAFFRRVI